MQNLNKIYYLLPAILYLFLSAIGQWVLIDRDSGRDLLAQEKAEYFLNEFYRSPQETWPLNKWDGVWYSAIAKDGYKIDKRKTSLRKPAFFPLYPYAIGLLMQVTGANFELASAVFSVSILTIIFWILREQKLVALLLLMMPTGFILICPYPEGLFLLFVMLQRKYLLKNKTLKSFICGFATGLTRVNAAIITFAYLAEALISLIKKQNAREVRASMISASAPALGLISYFAVLQLLRNNFFLYFEVKRSFGGSFSNPIATFMSQLERTQRFFTFPEIWPKVTCSIEWVTVVLLLFAIIYLYRNQKYFESAMAIAVLGLSSMAGSFWGLQRYTYAQYCIVVLFGMLIKERNSRLALIAFAFLMCIFQGFQFWAYLQQNAPSV